MADVTITAIPVGSTLATTISYLNSNQSALRTGIVGNIEPKTRVLGSPAMPADDAKRTMLAVQKLPQWIKRIKELEREVAELRKVAGRESEGQTRSCS